MPRQLIINENRLESTDAQVNRFVESNPIATINSVAMMLQFSLDQQEAAQRLDNAVETVLNQGYRTPDIMRPGYTELSTTQMGDQVCSALRNAA